MRRVEIERRGLKSIPSRLGGLLGDFARDNSFEIEILPRPDLSLTEKKTFKISLPSEYPLRAPIVHCSDKLVEMPILDEKDQWSRNYDTTVIFYALRRRYLVETEEIQLELPRCQHRPPHFQMVTSEAATIGRRRDMEDVTKVERGLVCVFDGHGGGGCAAWAGEHVPRRVFEQMSRRNDTKEALRQAVIESDRMWSNAREKDGSGCTAIAVYFESPQVYVANLGDCRCVLARREGRGSLVAHDLSRDARADRPDEIARICEAGGFVSNRRVNGQLAVSRALGDLAYKDYKASSINKGPVSCEPDVVQLQLDASRDEFLVVACDGLWDVLSSQQVVEFVRVAIQQYPFELVAEKLVKYAVDDKMSTDNVSVVVVRLLRGDDENAENHRTHEPQKPPQLENDDDLFEYLLDDRNFLKQSLTA